MDGSSIKLNEQTAIVSTDGEAIKVGEEENVRISFNQTVTLAGDRSGSVTGFLGIYPVYSRTVIREGQKIHTNADFIVPMHDEEAVFISFSSASIFAIKVFLGPINVITGNRDNTESTNSLIDKEKQDYIVAPEQRWIDGITTGNSQVRQFVAKATTKGSRYNVEAHLKKSELKGGFHFVVVPPKNPVPQGKITTLPSSFNIHILDKFGQHMLDLLVSSRFTVQQVKNSIEPKIVFSTLKLFFKGKILNRKHYTLEDYQIGKDAILIAVDSGIKCRMAPKVEIVASLGGIVKQEMHADRWPSDFWRDRPLAVFGVQIINSSLFRKLTGITPPGRTMDEYTYMQLGLPYFTLPSSGKADSCKKKTTASSLRSRKIRVRKELPATKPAKVITLDSENPSRAVDPLVALAEAFNLDPNNWPIGFSQKEPSSQPRHFFKRFREQNFNKE